MDSRADFGRDRFRITAVFFLQSIVMAMQNMRIPDIQLDRQLNDAQLGLILTAAPIGALLTYSLSARWIDTLGTRNIIVATCCLSALTAAMLPVAPGMAGMFLVLLVNGALVSGANIAINVEADRVEAGTKARIMNRCHGVWSVGFLLASLVAGAARGAGITPLAHLAILFPIYTILTLFIVVPMREFPHRAHASTKQKRSWVMPTAAVFSLVSFGLGAELLEGASRVWATIYLRDTFAASVWVQSAGLPALIFTMAAGRLFADRWIDRIGPRIAAWRSIAATLTGVAIIVFAPSAYVAIAGFAIAGLGAGVVYPLMLSSAARLGDRPAAENVAAITLIVQLAMLVAPFAIGVIAEGASIRAAFAALLPLLAVGVLMSRVVR